MQSKLRQESEHVPIAQFHKLKETSSRKQAELHEQLDRQQQQLDRQRMALHELELTANSKQMQIELEVSKYKAAEAQLETLKSDGSWINTMHAHARTFWRFLYVDAILT